MLGKSPIPKISSYLIDILDSPLDHAISQTLSLTSTHLHLRRSTTGNTLIYHKIVLRNFLPPTTVIFYHVHPHDYSSRFGFHSCSLSTTIQSTLATDDGAVSLTCTRIYCRIVFLQKFRLHSDHCHFLLAAARKIHHVNFVFYFPRSLTFFHLFQNKNFSPTHIVISFLHYKSNLFTGALTTTHYKIYSLSALFSFYFTALYHWKYDWLQSRADPHHLDSCNGGQGRPPRFACLTTFRWRCISPMPHVLLQALQSLHCPTRQSRGARILCFFGAITLLLVAFL